MARSHRTDKRIAALFVVLLIQVLSGFSAKLVAEEMRVVNAAQGGGSAISDGEGVFSL